MQPVMMAPQSPQNVIMCYQCRNQMAFPPGVTQGQCPSCGAMNQTAPQPQPVMFAPQMNTVPQAQAVMYAQQAVMVAPPVHQVMTDILGILGPQKGILMRQRMDLLEALTGWEQRNKYQVATKPHDKGDNPSEWEDETFRKQLKHGHLLTLKEESECCARQLCRPRHTLSIKIKGGDDTKVEGETLAEFDRPFKCTLLCCCTLFNPQVLTISIKGAQNGRVIQHWPCMNNLFVCHRYWRVVDGSGKDVYMIRDDFCCNQNMCAPSICCPARHLDILTPDMNTKVGSIIDVFPGCNVRGCFGTADNYILNFPDTATPADKLNLLGALILIEYMVFEKKPKRNRRGVGLDAGFGGMGLL